MDNIRSAGLKLNELVKDEFYVKIMEEMMDVQDRQRNVFKTTKD
jgi:hypothetical protein